MKKMQVTGFGAPLAETDETTPVPKGKEVLLRVRAAGVCHTDLHLWHGGYDLGHGRTLSLTERGVTLPLVMGHENVGMVAAVGEDADPALVGTLQLVYPWMGCGQCETCQAGTENMCLTPSTIGINRAGGYADHLLVPDARCLVALQGLDPVSAAPLACSGLTCFSALHKIGAETYSRHPIVVVGAGGLGLMCLKLLAGLGGKGAVVIEPDQSRREAALAAGALAVVDPHDPDAATQIRDAVGGPVRAVLDLVANPETAALGFDVLTKGGKLILVGLFGGATPWSLPLIPMKSITIQGSYVGSLPELRELIALVARERLELVPVHTCGLNALGDALRALQAGKVVGRMVMTP